ncbi:DNA repair XRCC4 isoform X1 [Pelobates cultripes]|uniref:DNA repair XRCC4 isoform X1 n=1 Tax=Pelobates cultripes TaxID=61616 RepID=A0AAD1SBT9_PELCU|nr:DNA repair XRCC4 isoform X1 [Pelobates cultripes]
MEYQAQSKAVLDQLCRERSIPCRGKTKEELLQALVDYDMQQAVQNDASNTAEEIPAAFVHDVPSSGDPLDCYLQTVLKYMDSADANQRLQLILQYQETAERQAEREAAERQAAREHELKMAELERLTASPPHRGPTVQRAVCENECRQLCWEGGQNKHVCGSVPEPEVSAISCESVPRQSCWEGGQNEHACQAGPKPELSVVSGESLPGQLRWEGGQNMCQSVPEPGVSVETCENVCRQLCWEGGQTEHVCWSVPEPEVSAISCENVPRQSCWEGGQNEHVCQAVPKPELSVVQGKSLPGQLHWEGGQNVYQSVPEPGVSVETSEGVCRQLCWERGQALGVPVIPCVSGQKQLHSEAGLDERVCLSVSEPGLFKMPCESTSGSNHWEPGQDELMCSPVSQSRVCQVPEQGQSEWLCEIMEGWPSWERKLRECVSHPVPDQGVLKVLCDNVPEENSRERGLNEYVCQNLPDANVLAGLCESVEGEHGFEGGQSVCEPYSAQDSSSSQGAVCMRTWSGGEGETEVPSVDRGTRPRSAQSEGHGQSQPVGPGKMAAGEHTDGGTTILVSISQSHLQHTPKPAQEKASVSKQLFDSEPKVQSKKVQRAQQTDHKTDKECGYSAGEYCRNRTRVLKKMKEGIHLMILKGACRPPGQKLYFENLMQTNSGAYVSIRKKHTIQILLRNGAEYRSCMKMRDISDLSGSTQAEPTTGSKLFCTCQRVLDEGFNPSCAQIGPSMLWFDLPPTFNECQRITWDNDLAWTGKVLEEDISKEANDMEMNRQEYVDELKKALISSSPPTNKYNFDLVDDGESPDCSSFTYEKKLKDLSIV